MNNKKNLGCHDCGISIIILDEYDEIEIKQMVYCPICGSENIETRRLSD